jgi:hypothetical protein
MERFDLKSKQDRQSTYNVTLRRPVATIVAVEKQYVLHIVSVCIALFIQRAMRRRHIVICALPRCTVFFPYLTNCTVFAKKN